MAQDTARIAMSPADSEGEPSEPENVRSSSIAQLQLDVTKLRQALQFHEMVLELTTNAIAVLDLEGRLWHLNRRALELTGRTREELEGRSFAVLIPADKLEATAVEVQRTLTEGVVVHGVETDILQPDGTRRNISFNLAPMMENGRVVGAVGTAEDETDRLRVQQALEKYAGELERSNRELVQFAYAASHDLQEPLRVVAGYLQLLETRQAEKLTPEGQRYIRQAVAAVERMHSLIGDLLAYARIGISIRHDTVALDGVMAQVRENLGVALRESGARLEQEPLPTLWGDASQLVQLFQNLIGNALKFRGQEAPVIRVSASRDGISWRCCVRDNGIGIAPEHAERIFLIFQRLHTRAEYPGNGVGLAICKKIVESHGGNIWAEPSPDGGTVFQFTIPDRVGETTDLPPRSLR
jgi:PAS domain S-box-containing protein